MKITITASYHVDLDNSQGLPGITTRRLRDGSVLTVMDCNIEKAGDHFYARPRHGVPEGGPRPTFRARLALDRALQATEGIAVVAQPADARNPTDFEQRLLAPVFSDAQRIVYEFQRGEVLYVASGGSVDIRLVVVEGGTGRVGTRTLANFHIRYADALARCRAHLAGATDLYPVRTPPGQKPADVPLGHADLEFHAGETAEIATSNPFG